MDLDDIDLDDIFAVDTIADDDELKKARKEINVLNNTLGGLNNEIKACRKSVKKKDNQIYNLKEQVKGAEFLLEKTNKENGKLKLKLKQTQRKLKKSERKSIDHFKRTIKTSKLFDKREAAEFMVLLEKRWPGACAKLLVKEKNIVDKQNQKEIYNAFHDRTRMEKMAAHVFAAKFKKRQIQEFRNMTQTEIVSQRRGGM